jgi:glucose-6-phosphate 1-dehydrogenase
MEMSTGTGYHQFQPLLYQAIAELTGRDITFDPDQVVGRRANIDARAGAPLPVRPYPPGSWGPAGAAASPAGHGGWHGPWIAS